MKKDLKISFLNSKSKAKGLNKTTLLNVTEMCQGCVSQDYVIMF